MKKILALMLALMMVASLAACGGAPASTPTAGNDIDPTETETGAAEKEINFEELAIYESDSFSIVVSSIDADSPSGYVLNLIVSNNSEPEEITSIEYVYEVNDEGESEVVEEIENVELVTTSMSCKLDSLKINGTEVEMNFTSQAESGSRNYDMIVIDPALADTLGEFTEIELSFSIYDTSNPDTVVTTASGIVYPYGNADASEAE